MIAAGRVTVEGRRVRIRPEVEGADDLMALEERSGEPLVSFEDMVHKLKADDRL